MAARNLQGAPPAYESLANGASYPAVPAFFSLAYCKRKKLGWLGGGGQNIVLVTEQAQTPLLDSRGVNTAESKKFNSQKFILQWLGIGYGCSFICLLFSLLLFGAGIAVIVITLVAGPAGKLKSCEYLITAKVLTIIAGGVLILLATYWPLVWFWHQSRRSRSFAPFICYAWLLSLCYAGILCALAVPVYEYHNLMFKPYPYQGDENCKDWTSSIPLWTFVPMGGMMVVFFAVSVIVCGCFNGAGSIW